MTIAEAIYLLCAATSLVAATMLFRQYLHRPSRLLRTVGSTRLVTTGLIRTVPCPAVLQAHVRHGFRSTP